MGKSSINGPQSRAMVVEKRRSLFIVMNLGKSCKHNHKPPMDVDGLKHQFMVIWGGDL